ncbi:hypothetical protein C2W62_13970 [Candidatus Entotheonella serta]|nr:hypothetical protein C2W62_13970 [Candidatus Entotheonella serta]
MRRIALITLLLQLKEIFQTTPLGIAYAIEVIDMHKINQHPGHIDHQLHIRHTDLLKTCFGHGMR